MLSLANILSVRWHQAFLGAHRSCRYSTALAPKSPQLVMDRNMFLQYKTLCRFSTYSSITQTSSSIKSILSGLARYSAETLIGDSIEC